MITRGEAHCMECMHMAMGMSGRGPSRRWQRQAGGGGGGGGRRACVRGARAGVGAERRRRVAAAAAAAALEGGRGEREGGEWGDRHGVALVRGISQG